VEEEQSSQALGTTREDVPDWWPYGGRVPTLARLAGRVRPGLRSAAAYQPAGRSARRGRGGPPQSDETSRGQDEVLQGLES
jgi:hypothetical protein